MNAPLNFQTTRIRSSKLAGRLSVNLAIGLAGLCVGAGLLMPVIKSRAGHHHAMPPGQFQAEVRTLIAEVRYLLDPEIAIEKHPAPIANSPATLAQHTPGRALGVSDRSFDQLGAPAGSSTNPPAQT